MDGGNTGNAGAVSGEIHSWPVIVPGDTGISHIQVGHSYGLKEEQARHAHNFVRPVLGLARLHRVLLT